MRGKARSPFQRIITAAVRATMKAQADSGFTPESTRFAGATSPPQNVTTPGETDGGVIYTNRIFMLGLDALGAPGAQLKVEGKVKDYGS